MTYHSATKIRNRHDAAAWREAQPGIVVFTNGVFDLVHPGHVVLLEAARNEGDVLIVGINSDASVKKLKGDDRPVMPEEARARVIAAFESVDCVVLFEEDTPFNLIQALEPDVLVKGGDYSRDNTVGTDIVEARGGRVKHVELEDGFSTTNIVERVRGTS